MRGSKPDVGDFFLFQNHQTDYGCTPHPGQWIPGDPSPGKNEWGLRLTTYLHLGLRLKISEVISPLPYTPL